MAFSPRFADDITLSMAARVVARSKLTDIGEGADLRFLLQAIGEELALIEQRLLGIRNSFDMLNPSISLADFDERLLELPKAQVRRGASSASGAVLTVARGLTASQQVLPAGSVFAKADGTAYKTTQAYTFAINVGTLSGLNVVCLTQGSAGNCTTGEITLPVSAPNWVTSVSNAIALANGVDAETKEQAQARIALYLQSLAKCQLPAIGDAALSFVSSTGGRLKFAKLAVDPAVPGRTAVVVDDGTGMAGLVQAGTAVTATVPATGIRTLWHEAPATQAIASVKITPVGGGNPKFLVVGEHYDSLYEQGLVRLKKDVVLTVGDIWEIAGYSIYVGILRELQVELQGDLSRPQTKPGWVAAGCRVFVQPPTVYVVSFDVHVVPVDGQDIYELQSNALAAAIAFTQTLGPGEPLFVARLIDALLQVQGMRNVHVFTAGTGTPLSDVYAGETEVIRSADGTVKVFPTLLT